jgi:murein DD-endopeptidase MepM/ murein hydrolase activator NlpD
MSRSWRNSRAAQWALLVALVTGSACSSGIYHVVQSGENLYRIGKAYGFHYTELARINDIEPPYVIRSGQRIFVPGADRPLPVKVITPSAVAPVAKRAPAGSGARPSSPVRPARGAAPPATSAAAKKAPPVQTPPPKHVAASGRRQQASGSGFVWPVSGLVASGYGPRGDGHHDGIDIMAELGSPIAAARAGRVIFSDKLSGYGNVIIVEHADGFTTVYAHNQRNLVRKGTTVALGAEIALVGRTGRAEGTHLHFEIRRHNVARDPIEYLPSR